VNDPLLKMSKPLLLERIRKAAPAREADADRKLTDLLGISTACKTALDQNKVDPNLSAQGRRNAAEPIARRALQQLADWEAANPDKISDQIRTLWERVLGIAAIKPPTDVAERIAYELRAREVRDQVRKLDSTTRLLLYFSATDPEVIAAFEDAPLTLDHERRDEPPKLVPFIDPDRVRTSMIERARAADPEAAAEMKALAVVRDAFDGAVKTAQNEILAEFPSLAHDPLVAQAAGITPTGR